MSKKLLKNDLLFCSAFQTFNGADLIASAPMLGVTLKNVDSLQSFASTSGSSSKCDNNEEDTIHLAENQKMKIV